MLTNGDPTTLLNNFFTNLLNIGAGIGVALAAFWLMWGAFLYMSAAGDPMQARAGKSAMLHAVGGLVLVLLARILAEMIKNALSG